MGIHSVGNITLMYNETHVMTMLIRSANLYECPHIRRELINESLIMKLRNWVVAAWHTLKSEYAIVHIRVMLINKMYCNTKMS